MSAPHTRYSIGLTLLLSLTFASSINAQDSANDDSTVRYPAAYFVQYGSVTAQDMIDRIPGLGNGSGGGTGGPPPAGNRNVGFGGRGLGSGGGDQVYCSKNCPVPACHMK